MMKPLAILTGIMGIGLIAFASYWYIYLWPDRSQFASFGILGFLLIYLAIVLWDLSNMSKEMDDIRGTIAYFEDKLVKEPEINELPIDEAMDAVRDKVKKKWDKKVDVYIQNNVKTKQDVRKLIKELDKVIKK